MIPIPMLNNENLYKISDFTYNSLKPFSDSMKTLSDYLDERNDKLQFPAFENNEYLLKARRIMAINTILARRFSQSYEKPEFGITNTKINNKNIDVLEVIVKEKSFCKLKHFKKQNYNVKQPKILLVAPMAGHYATLLRGTVTALLQDYDVYITDWENARDIPLSEGSFDLNTYVNYLIDFMEELSPNLNVMAICQPGVPLMAAVSLMEANKNPKIPQTIIIKGSPIDARKGKTEINNMINDKPVEWFHENVICIVPKEYKGAMRLVYPGFLQLGGFMNMNPSKHQKSIMGAVQNYIDGNFKDSEKVSDFYLEYFSVMDLTAEFYMQTIFNIFKDFTFPQGKMIMSDQLADPKAISNVPILIVEGELDDICGIGQTKAALEITPNLSSDKKEYLLVEKAGHYGIFNGSKFQNIVLPKINQFVKKHHKTSKVSKHN